MSQQTPTVLLRAAARPAPCAAADPRPPEARADSSDSGGRWEAAPEVLETIEPLDSIDLPGGIEALAADPGAGRYDARSMLGVGGMGEVRLCHDRWIGREVAVKALRSQEGAALARRRFMREVRVQGQLEHPSIVPVYDLGMDAEGRPWEASKVGLAAYLVFFAAAPLFLALGLRSWPVPVAGTVLTALTAGGCWWYARRRRLPARGLAVLALLNATIVAAMSNWLGPFILVPTAAAVSTLYLSTQARPRQRPMIILLGVLAAVVPVALELAHLVPPSFRIAGDQLVLTSRSFHVPPTLTLVILVHASVSWLIFPPLALGRVRDALRRAEQQLFLHAWHFRRLLGE